MIEEIIDTIIQGDCLDVMRNMPDDSVDLIVTSPPYDNLRDYYGYTLAVPAMALEFMRIMKQGGVIVWVVGDATINGSETGTSFRQALTFMGAGFKLHDTMIWNKGSFTAVGTLKWRYASVFEYMFVFTKGAAKTFNPIKDRKNYNAGARLCRERGIRQVSGEVMPNNAWKNDRNRRIQPFGIRFNVWNMPGSNTQSDKSAFEHPASFPDKLAADHIISWSDEGDLVFDPMCGSGTTCKMAERLNRHWIGIDISPEYCDIARERIRIEQSQLKLAL